MVTLRSGSYNQINFVSSTGGMERIKVIQHNIIV